MVCASSGGGVSDGVPPPKYTERSGGEDGEGSGRHASSRRSKLVYDDAGPSAACGRSPTGITGKSQ